ncbi:MAG: type VII toxin-antitoxin system HepT family RNase toxin [Vulcanisaeta sp.]|uniref:type VII toxin-antitoxin system HepT family RNase toxin n=1 Tax=Vulcanisaeta sp. TaxID=2020871 RepID=UPI003D129765
MGVSKEFIKGIIRDVEDAIKEIERITNKPYDELSDEDKMAIRYELIVIAEAVMALAMHIVRRELNERPRTPINALMILRDKGLLMMNEYEDLTRLVRLRNLLVHRYWVIDDYLIYQSIKSNFKNLASFINRLRDRYGI